MISSNETARPITSTGDSNNAGFNQPMKTDSGKRSFDMIANKQNDYDKLDNNVIDESYIRGNLSYEEQLRRQTILNSLENMDYLLIIASQQHKSVQQVKYELMLKLVNG